VRSAVTPCSLMVRRRCLSQGSFKLASGAGKLQAQALEGRRVQFLGV
jgi:hypothetical protein